MTWRPYPSREQYADDYDPRDWEDPEDRSLAAKQRRWEAYQDALADQQHKAEQESRA